MTASAAARIPQTDPRAAYFERKDEIGAAISSVLNGGRYILGDEVAAFEREFADFVKAREAIGVGNGTDALEIALRACDIGPGDLVYTVSHTAVATVAAIELVGATPVLVDIDQNSFTMSPEALDSSLQKSRDGRPAAVIPVHLYGSPADLPAIREIADRHQLRVIEDCAQSHGATLNGRTTGTWGDFSTFSFYPTKNLGAIGDGGCIVTSDSSLAERARMLRQYGWRQRYISDTRGGNSRLDEIQASILRVKLRYLAQDNQRRRDIAARYRERLSGLDLALPRERKKSTHVYHQFVIRHSRRDELREHLSRDGIDTLIHYQEPVHLQPAYRERLHRLERLDVTERVVREIVSLPMFPQLELSDVDRVCDAIASFKS